MSGDYGSEYCFITVLLRTHILCVILVNSHLFQLGAGNSGLTQPPMASFTKPLGLCCSFPDAMAGLLAQLPRLAYAFP